MGWMSVGMQVWVRVGAKPGQLWVEGGGEGEGASSLRKRVCSTMPSPRTKQSFKPSKVLGQ